MSEDATLSHLEALREDTRDEVKRRIQQRDQYSMQLTVALGAVVIGAFSTKGTPRLFALAPLISIYFTALILYSYRIHDVLATYLRREIEPRFATLCGIPTEKEWETWYVGGGRKPGMRRLFFVIEMWAVIVLSLAYVWHKTWSEPRSLFTCALLVGTVTYIFLGAWTSLLVRKWRKD